MAAMLVKNALQSLRSRPSNLRALILSSISTTSFSVPTSRLVPPSSMWRMATPLNHKTDVTLVFAFVIDDLVQFPLVLGDHMPELTCPTDSFNAPLQAIKRTYQPSVLRRKRKHGFRTRRVSISGRKILKRRFNKGRWRMSL